MFCSFCTLVSSFPGVVYLKQDWVGTFALIDGLQAFPSVGGEARLEKSSKALNLEDYLVDTNWTNIKKMRLLIWSQINEKASQSNKGQIINPNQCDNSHEGSWGLRSREKLERERERRNKREKTWFFSTENHHKST